MRRAAFGLAVAVVLVVAWMARFDVVHLRGNNYLLLDRLTGTVRYCEAVDCYPVADDKTPPRPPQPAEPRQGTYEDLIPKK